MPKVEKKVAKKPVKKASPLLDEEQDTTETESTVETQDNEENGEENGEETHAVARPKDGTILQDPSIPVVETKESFPADKDVAPERLNASSGLKSDIEVTRKNLAKEPTVHLMIPLNGEKAGSFEDVWINGFHTRVPKGVMSIVPQSIAELINNKYNIEQTVGAEFRLDLNPDKHDRVS